MSNTYESVINTKPLMLAMDTAMTIVIATMAQTRSSCVLVLNGQRLVGIFTERDLVRAISRQQVITDLTLLDVMTIDVIRITEAEAQDIFAVSRLFSQHGIRHLPVVNDEQVVGVITPLSLRNLFKPEHLLRYIRVAEVMQRQVVMVSPYDCVQDVVKRMTAAQVSCVVVVEPHSQQPQGVVTEHDIVRLQSLGTDFVQTLVKTIMSTPVRSMRPNESLWQVHQYMLQSGIRRLLITDDRNRLLGIVTQTQMLRLVDPAEMYHVMQQMQNVIEEQTKELQRLNDNLQVANDELRQLAALDELTQIANRRRFNECLEHEWRRMAEHQQPLSLILGDIDDFKAYNDLYGHPAGDECLKSVADIFHFSTHSVSDVVARYGGEEFVMILPYADQQAAERIAQKILATIAHLRMPHEGSSTGFLTVSLGVATCIPQMTVESVTLIQHADQQLYRSKGQGCNTYHASIMA